MTMKEQNQAPRFEPRWPVALAILAVIGLLALPRGANINDLSSVPGLPSG